MDVGSTLLGVHLRPRCIHRNPPAQTADLDLGKTTEAREPIGRHREPMSGLRHGE